MRALYVTAASVAAVAVLVGVTLPRRQLALSPFSDGTIRGTIHVHTNRSDGRASVDDVARAAARAGLKFVIFTDHGDGTRAPEPPAYRSGVLCLDAVEISTTEGHYLALGMPVAPYPLNGEARDVVEDVHRLGGFGVVAHPESPKPALSWRAWDTPFDGIEWINPDTSWRARLQGGWRSRLRLAADLAAYPIRPAEAIAQLLDATALRADRWNTLARARQVVILAGADAHANLPFGGADPRPGTGALSLPIPSYEASFRALSIYVEIDRALSGEAAADGDAILKSLRAGHAHVVVDGLASPASFTFTADSARGSAREGDRLPGSGPATIRVRSNAPREFTTILHEDDRVLESVRGNEEIRRVVTAPAVYRVEIEAPADGAPVPWLISNPIYVGVTFPAPTPEARRAIVERRALFDGRTTAGWWTEADPRSRAMLETEAAGGPGLRFRYALATGSSSGQYAAMATRIPAAERFDRLTLAARADGPLRISVQLRAPGARRWQRSIYLDQTEREFTVAFADMRGVAGAPDFDSGDPISEVLIVVDTTHTQPGASGYLWLTSAALQR